MKYLFTQELTAQEFYSLSDNDRRNISHAEIVTAGKKDFGKIKVFYKTPKYTVRLNPYKKFE